MAVTLTHEQCVKYIRNIKDLEISCYNQNLLYRNLVQRLDEAQKPLSTIANRAISDPGIAPEKRKIKTPFQVLQNYIAVTLLFGIPAILLGGALGAAWWLIRVIFTKLTFKDPMLPSLIWGAAILFLISLFFVFLSQDSNKPERIEKEYNDAIQKYEAKVKSHKQALARRDRDLTNQQARVTYLQEAVNQCTQNIYNTRSLLDRYYNMGYLYPKYRRIVPVCAFCEYLEAGRCDSLTGPNGAYNIYENEVLMKRVIEKLDDVIARLDDINYNQQLIAQELCRGRSQISQILQSVDSSIRSVQQSSAITSYYARITAMNTEYLTWADLLRS